MYLSCVIYSLLIYVVKYLLCMNLCLDFLGMEDFLDHAVFVHQVSGAQRAHGLASAKGLFAPAAEGLLQGGLGVGDEGEVQAVFLGKFQLSRTFVAADADDGVAGSLELCTVGLQGAGFGGTAGRVGPRVAVEDDFAAGKVGCLDFTAVLVDAQHGGDFVAYVNHGFGGLLGDGFKLVLAHSAEGAEKILGQIFECRARRYAMFGVTHGGIVLPAAYYTYVLFHILSGFMEAVRQRSLRLVR